MKNSGIKKQRGLKVGSIHRGPKFCEVCKTINEKETPAILTVTLFENDIVYMKIILFTFMLNSGFLKTPIKFVRGCPRGWTTKKNIVCGWQDTGSWGADSKFLWCGGAEGLGVWLKGRIAGVLRAGYLGAGGY